ncbi:hypothetical protein OAA22_00470 [bacterium]|jgi:hypothetical protein|nr:hypothetical protein [bacterium]|tara:strand:+ start:1605 stop:1943 length:339 start_codon:yes stop_codon:yes gene_type:complete
MLLRELFDIQHDSMPFDVIDDVHFHMINDEIFYRKHYMPCMDKMKSETNEKVIQGYIMPLCDKALNDYCLKYDINQLPAELMTAQEKADLAHKVLDHERNPKEDLDATTRTF